MSKGLGGVGALMSGAGMFGGTSMGAAIGITPFFGGALLAGGAVAGLASNYFDWDDSQDAIDDAIKRTKAMRKEAIGSQKENTSYQRTTSDELLSHYAMSEIGNGEGYKSLYGASQGRTNDSVHQEQAIATMYDNAISQLEASKSEFDWFGNSSEAAYNTIESVKGLYNSKARREQQKRTDEARKKYDALYNQQLDALSDEYDEKAMYAKENGYLSHDFGQGLYRKLPEYKFRTDFGIPK